MQVDKTTLSDLSIFHAEEAYSVFHRINFTRTVGGKEYLHRFLSRPLTSIEQIRQTQQVLQIMIQTRKQLASNIITNGTIMVIERFYDTPVTDPASKPGVVDAFLYRVFNTSDFSLIRYSVKHFIDMLTGLQKMADDLSAADAPPLLQSILHRIAFLLRRPELQEFIHPAKDPSITQVLKLAHFMRRRFKEEAFEMIDLYSKLDAYYSMGRACEEYGFCFPELVESDEPVVRATALYHPLLPAPVSYDLDLSQEQHFLFLTGANMAGKSTFIKAAGVALYLAHIGMGVPARSMRLSLFDGLLSNINVVDNIIQGESYFFNEVQRIKNTIEKISDGKKWLILIDELFKGTNVQDAMKCSTTVIEGLRRMKNALFILSTHLYEIGDSLKNYSNIQFRYFETNVENDQLIFSYQIREGISNDRLGYLILKKEGVVDLLGKL